MEETQKLSDHNNENPNNAKAVESADAADIKNKKAALKTSVYYWLWGTIVVLALLTFLLSVIPFLRQSNALIGATDSKQFQVDSSELSAVELDVFFNIANKAGVRAVQSKMSLLLDEAYQPAYGAIQKYADYHYSIEGEYTELALSALGDPVEKLNSILFKGLGDRLENMNADLDRAYNEAFKLELANTVQGEEGTDSKFGKLTSKSISDALTRVNYTAPIASAAALSGYKVTAKAATVISKKIATKAAAKVAAKTSGKVAASMTTAGAVAIPCGPLAPVCGVVGGSIAWFATDYGILLIDESWNREAFEADLRSMIEDVKVEHQEFLEQALTARFIASQEMADVIVEHQDFTLRELSGIGNQKICVVATELNSQYEFMNTSLDARSPQMLTFLRNMAADYEGNMLVGRMAKEIRGKLKSAEQVVVTYAKVMGNLPLEYRANRDVSGKLILNDKSFLIEKTKVADDAGFLVSLSIDTVLSMDKPLIYDIALEQHLRIKSNPYFAASGKTDHLYELGSSEGLNKEVTLTAVLGRDGNANSIDTVSMRPAAGEMLTLILNMQAKPLPALEKRPEACGL